MSVINITEDQMKRFQRIRDTRPQDSKARDTFDYILRVFEESPSRLRNPGSASPMTDATRVVTPSTLAEKLYADKQRMDAVRANNEAVKEHKE